MGDMEAGEMTVAAALFIGAALALVASWLLASRVAAAGFRVPDPARRIGHIDGLRGYLALFVMFSHFTLWSRKLALGIPWAVGPDPMLAVGQVPVAMFFMITAVLFYPTARRGFRAVDWRAFFMSRVFRIYPLAIASVAVILVALWWRSGFTLDPATLLATAVNLLWWLSFLGQPPLFGAEDSALANAGVFWSLGSEWLFYLVVVPVLAIARDATRGWLPEWTTPLWALAVALMLRVVWPEQAEFMVHFMLGMFLLQLREHPALASWFRRSDVAAVSLLLAAAAIAFLRPPISDRTAIFYAPLLACIVCGQDFRGLLSHPASIVLGEVSFGIYVLHGMVLRAGVGMLGGFVADHPMLAGVLLLPMSALCVVALAAAAHVAIERPMIERGRRLAKRLRARAVPVPSAVA